MTICTCHSRLCQSNLGAAAGSSSSDNTARPGFDADADNGGGDDDSAGSDDDGSAGSDDNGDENGPIATLMDIHAGSFGETAYQARDRKRQ